MKKLVKKIAEACKDAIEEAAYDSYGNSNSENTYDFDGCRCMIDLLGDNQIEISCDKYGKHEVLIYKDTECSNVELAITEYLDANADEFASWQEAFDDDMWRDVDAGCDPAFPHHGDFERWAYGR